MLILPNMIYRFNAITINILAGIFVDTDKLTVVLTRKGKEARIVKTI
jgi:hypothetical protein